MLRHLTVLAMAAAFVLINDARTSPSAAQATAPSTVMVLDVSNSMWGQIDGVSKIEIAREVIADLMKDWNPATDLGLVAYGHRREGDCGDIETVIPVGPVETQSFVETVNSLVPRGKTPLTDAVRQAAEILNYRDVPATVILVSDGIESCQADPCALAADLEKAGINFTAHVVGFDVKKAADQAQLSCIAENTGGEFLTASTADELLSAMQTVSTGPTPPLITLEALMEEGGAPIADPDLRWTVVSMVDESSVLADASDARPVLPLEPGRYLARATLGEAAGAVEFDVSETDIVTHQVILAAPVSVSPPSEAEASTTISVPWQGPNNAGDYLSVAEPGAAGSAFLTYVRTNAGNPSALALPEEPGQYEVRYVDAKTGEVLASAPIVATGLTASLEVPEEVDAGAGFEVIWQGPNEPGDFITIVAPDAPPDSFENFVRTDAGSPAQLTAPDGPGTFEVRYVLARTQQPLASAPVVVIVSATLEAPPAADAGSEVAVTWTGPDNQGDYITVVPAEAEDGTYTNYAYTRSGSPATVRLSDEPGQYELRYVSGTSSATLARLPITVNPVSATLEAPPSVGAGSEVAVAWTGPDNQGDYVTVVETGAKEGAYTHYAYTHGGSPASVRMPDEPGQYELRYVTGGSSATLARLPITVAAVSATLEAPPTAGAGSEVAVAWTGPDNQGDYITVVAAGAKEGSHANYAYTRTGSPAAVRMPDEPGQYELRYVTGGAAATLASLPITVNEVSATLEAPPSAGAGSEVAVTWTGPDNKNDYIAVIPAGAPEKERTTYAYTRNGSPASVRLPDEPGAYELHYVLGQSRASIASIPIAVNAVSAALEAPPSADAGAEIAVTWTGPDNKNDYIAVIPAGAPEKERTTYAYTRNGSPATVRMPDEPGSYELHYVTGQARESIASVPITVNAVSATLEAPPSAGAGSEVAVAWVGPDNKNDYIALVPAGAPEKQRTTYAYTRNGSPAMVRMSDEPGQYELHYVSGQSRTSLTSLPITIDDVSATLDAPPSVDADTKFEVSWTGPDTKNDYVAVAEIGSPDKKQLTYAYTRNGTPASVKAPKEPGQYELRYVMGQSRRVLVRLPLTVQ